MNFENWEPKGKVQRDPSDKVATIIGKAPAWATKMFTKAVLVHYKHLPMPKLVWGYKNASHHVRYKGGGHYDHHNLEIVVGAATTNVKWLEHVLIHEIAHWVTRAAGLEKGYSSRGTKGGSCDGHCDGFWEVYFGHVFPTLKKQTTWKFTLESEFQYKPMNAYRVAKKLKVPNAKKVFDSRPTYKADETNRRLRWNAHRATKITSKSELFNRAFRVKCTAPQFQCDCSNKDGFVVELRDVDPYATYYNRKTGEHKLVIQMGLEWGLWSEEEFGTFLDEFDLSSDFTHYQYKLLREIQQEMSDDATFLNQRFFGGKDNGSKADNPKPSLMEQRRAAQADHPHYNPR